MTDCYHSEIDKTMIINMVDTDVSDFLNHGWKFDFVSRNGTGEIKIVFKKEKSQ